MEIVVSALIILGIVAAIITIIKYPRDVARGLFGMLLIPFERAGNFLLLMFMPLIFLIIFIEKKLGISYLTRIVEKLEGSSKAAYKAGGRKPINFRRFDKYIVINQVDLSLSHELKQASDSISHLNPENYSLSFGDNCSIIRLSDIPFYGYNVLIQWLADYYQDCDVLGYCTNGRSSFVTLVDEDADNNMIGVTNRGRAFWLNMYEDLNRKQFLRLSDEVKVPSNVNTQALGRLIERAKSTSNGV